MSGFQIEVRVSGPEYTNESTYGSRTERDALAWLEVPVPAEVAWAIYQEALATACALRPKVERAS